MNAGWTEVTLGDVCQLHAGVGFPRALQGRTSGAYPVAKVADVSRASRSGADTIESTENFVSDADLARLRARPVPAGSVLFAKIGEAIRHNHRIMAARPMLFDNNVMAAVPDDDIDPRFLLHYLRTVDFYPLTSATSVPALRKSELQRVPVPLPPLDDQRRVVRVLDLADRVRNRRTASLSVIDEARAAVFASTVAASNGSRPLVPVSDLADETNGGIRTGPFGSQLLHSEFVDEGIAVLGIDNAVANEFRWGVDRHITEAKYAQLRRYTVHPGDVLITIMGTCGRAAVVPDDIGRAINTKHLCCITLDQSRCLPEFLHAYFLRHPIARHHLASRTKGAIMGGLNMGIIKELPVSLPPIDVQHELVNHLAAVDRARKRAVTQREHLDSLFKSLQQRAFSGSL